MKVECWVIGKTDEAYLRNGEEKYLARIKHYLPFQWVVLPAPRKSGKLPPELLRRAEGDSVLRALNAGDTLVILDERGKQYSSEHFALYLDKQLHGGGRRLIFLIGGAFGFSDEVYERANGKLSLSSMTFSHQMVRLFFLEQLYRGLSILRNEPYHNP